MALTVGEVAKRSGIPVSTLHFYEEKGLISSWRTDGNQRRYHRAVLRRVAIIKIAQRAGIPLNQIAESLADLPQDHVPTEQDWKRFAHSWKVLLDERIANLHQMRDQITSCIGCGCLSLKECPLRNPGDRMAKYGPWMDRLPRKEH
jgi:MerR family redox-sensitive transcriptional activator SoxR